MSLPHCSSKCNEEWALGDVLWFSHGPVIRSEGPSEGALTQCNDKVHKPEQGKEVVDLEDQVVTVIHTLSTVGIEVA